MQDPQQTAPRDINRTRHRPLIPVVAGFALGIALDEWFRPDLLQWLLFGVPPALAALVGGGRDWRPAVNWVLALLVLVPVGGAYHLLSFRHRPPHHLSRTAPAGRELYRVRGTVKQEPRRHYSAPAFPSSPDEPRRFWTLRVEVSGISGRGGRWKQAAGAVTVFCSGQRPEAWPGDGVRVLGYLEGNEPPTNPGRANVARRYERMGTSATLSVPTGEAVKVTGRSAWWEPWTAVGRLRTHLERRMLWRGEPLVEGLTAALVFGQRGRIEPDTARLFYDSGVVHFLAISGLHVAVFAGLVTGLLLLAGVRPWARAQVLICAVWLYVLFTGAHTSAMRAGVMVTMAGAAPLVGRRYDLPSAMLAAALLILLIDPTELFGAGFQLSFAAVWGILYVYEHMLFILWPWQRFLWRVRDREERAFWRERWMEARSALLLAVCAWVATAPLNAAHFHRISLLSPLLYVVLSPMVAPLLVCSMGVAGLSLVGLPAGWLAAVTAHLGGSITGLLRLASGVPGFVHFTAGPPWWWVGLFYGGVSLWLWRGRLRGARKALVVLAVGLGVSYMVVDFAGARPGRFRLTVLDVGHGSAVAMRTPTGRTVMYDAGSSSVTDRRVAADFLWSRRVRRIDSLVLSHRNFDHVSFVPFLARRFGVVEVLLPPRGELSGTGRKLHRSLIRQHVQSTGVSEGTLLTGGALSLRCLHPGARFGRSEELSANERSVVLKGSYGDFSFLLPGDLGRAGLKRLMEEHGDELRADMLLLPHHGGWSPALERLVEHVEPRFAVASTGRAVRDRRVGLLLERMGVPLWSTERDGAVSVSAGGDWLQVEGFASSRGARFRSER